ASERNATRNGIVSDFTIACFPDLLTLFDFGAYHFGGEGSNMSNAHDPASELAAQALECWKTTVAVQQHFNTLQLQLRKFGLTLYLAVLATAGLAIKEHSQITIRGYTTSAAVLACMAGAILVLGFYYMDWGYHRLLKGAVDHGMTIEESLKERLPQI